MKTWVKLYTEIVNDPEIAELSLAERGVWMLLLALCGQLDHRDEQDRETGQLDTSARIAWYLRCSASDLEPAIVTLTRLGMVDERDGVLYLTNYARRQATPPSGRNEAVAQRVHDFRDKKRETPVDVTPLQTPRNEPVTQLDKSRVDKIRVEGEKSAQERESPPPTTKVDTKTPIHMQKDPRPVPVRVFADAAQFDLAPGSPAWEELSVYPTDDRSLTKLKEAIREWRLRGYKSANVAGILEWAKNGIPPRGQTPQQRQQTQVVQQTQDEQAAKLQRDLRSWNLAHGIKEAA